MDVNLFKALLKETSWTPVFESHDVAGATEAFYNILYQLFDMTVPKKKRPAISCSRYPVWFDAGIIKDVRRKARLHKLWMSSNSASLYEEFAALRANLKFRASEAYKSHLAGVEENMRLNPRQFWGHVHRLKSKGGFEPSVLHKGDSCTGIQAAEAFACYFASVFLEESPLLDASAYCEQGVQGGYVSAPAISPEVVERSIGQLKLNSSVGPDGVPSFVLKSFKKQMTFPLYHIFDLCLKSGKYPEQWKLSRVTPIPKSKDKTLVEEYRPIAILCAPAKIFEYILQNDLYRQVKQHIGDEQHGFRPGRSVNTNLLCFTDYVSRAIDRGLQVDVVYFDFQKAFDRVDNDVLLLKLSAIGLTPGLVKFFSDYLRNRRQYVKYGTYYSAPYHTRSGVSQGSVLGPLLFLIMIHDLPSVLSVSNCLLYADDLKIFLEITSPDDCMKMQVDIDHIFNWSIKNKMLFNANKCNVMTFERKRSHILFDYHLDTQPINRVNCIKDLGITFDRALTFHDHIDHLAKEGYRRLGFVLRNAKDFQNPHVVSVLYNALVRSKLEAGACVWNPYHVTYARMLEKIQKAFLRTLYKKLYGYYPYLYPTKFLLGHLGYNSLEVRRKVDQITTCLKVLKGSVDCVLLHNLLCVLHVPEEIEIPPTRRGPGRQHNLFHPDTGRTVARAMSPLVLPLRHLNALRDFNKDFDIAFNKNEWSTVLHTVMSYCEGLWDQWSGTKHSSDSSDSE